MSAELIDPYGQTHRLAELDISRLAFEYRNTHLTERDLLNALSAELQRRDEAWAEMRAFIERWVKIIDTGNNEPWAQDFIREAKATLADAAS